MRLGKSGYQTRSLLFSDRPTIEPAHPAHKPADSGVVVGNGARRCSLLEVFRNAFKQVVWNASRPRSDTRKKASTLQQNQRTPTNPANGFDAC
jgi:hypothetical protein